MIDQWLAKATFDQSYVAHICYPKHPNPTFNALMQSLRQQQLVKMIWEVWSNNV